ncbi:MAG: hypothetical protein M3O34_15685 [Chloroflexota bacterium]|nr:hypothetical protein [Chloroflexota bacterium]
MVEDDHDVLGNAGSNDGLIAEGNDHGRERAELANANPAQVVRHENG